MRHFGVTLCPMNTGNDFVEDTKRSPIGHNDTKSYTDRVIIFEAALSAVDLFQRMRDIQRRVLVLGGVNKGELIVHLDI